MPPLGSQEPLYVHDRRPILIQPELGDAAYSVQEDIDGGLVVLDNETMLIMGVFRADMREFAEDMRDRLIVRRLAGRQVPR